ncbi:oxidoreductase [Paenibacillus bovis]|uniref:Oxidoreductase n=2 Tax=Paenibacillus bovis TaxID=1616788 RepID=A0A172ZBI4_9BACL|nr:oxidoreductase [Paenibacillus bovis]
MALEQKVALVAGATGLVGQALTELLIQAPEYSEVIVLVRKPVERWQQHDRLRQVIVDYEHLEQQRDELRADDIYCCLGTTIRKAKTQENMYRIDVTYPLELARIAHEEGATQFLVVSAMGADSQSSVFYSRIKGELEQQLAQIGYESLSIVRPSLLLGKRREFRLGERTGAILARVLSPLFIGPMNKYKAISAEIVAEGMYRIACRKPQGTVVYLSNQLHIAARPVSR